MEQGIKCGFLGGEEAVEALRSSGYKNTATAIGELIDNSIQAGAKEITIAITKEKVPGDKRSTLRPTAIAVIDDGEGMDEKTLQKSLVIGEGNNRNQTRGMGKFGVGLPQASISQAKRVDVWSWQNSDYEHSKHVYIDLSDDSWRNDLEIKPPDTHNIHSKYARIIPNNPSGTIVEWRILDRITWQKPSTIFEKCAVQIGRMYRYWLHDETVKIQMAIIDPNGKIEQKDLFKAVDPLFLMSGAEYRDSEIEPMFNLYKKFEKSYKIPTAENDKEVRVDLTFSIAKQDVRIPEDSVGGRKEYGKLAKECIGVSVVREERELELNEQWYTKSPKDPRHRWWGAEIKFSRDLDEIFGVTNNKQSATKLDEFAGKSTEELLDSFGAESGESMHHLVNRLKDESPEDHILLDVVWTVQRTINEMASSIFENSKELKAKKAERYTGAEAQKRYDAAVESRAVSSASKTDLLVKSRGDNRLSAVEESLKNSDISESDRSQIIDDVKEGHRCSILVRNTDSSAFFNVTHQDTQLVVSLNSNHPVYDNLFEKFHSILNGECTDMDDVKISAKDAFDTIQYILIAWARMEEEGGMEGKIDFLSLRQDWGQFLIESYKNDNQ